MNNIYNYTKQDLENYFLEIGETSTSFWLALYKKSYIIWFNDQFKKRFD